MIPIVTPAEMASVDAAATEPLDVLVGRAGAAVARVALELLGGAYGRTVNVVHGPGNNGADGLVAADRLATRGVRVRRFAVADVTAPGGPSTPLPPADLVIDAAFGTGYRVGDRAPYVPPPVGGTPVLAVDIPSGVDGLTGAAGPGVWPATRTITFQALKPGLLFGDGPGLCGPIDVADVGLGGGVAELARAHLVTATDVVAWWPRRPVDTHKWRSGLRVVAGSPDMPGAARLTAAAAGRAGAGYVALTAPGCAATAASDEVVVRAATGPAWEDDVLVDLTRFRALAIGPGLGRSPRTVAAVRSILSAAALPAVLDGDGLHAVADATAVLRGRGVPTVLTPHDGEYVRLTGRPPGPDRLAAARALAIDTGCVVLLKGPTTVVADGERFLVVDHGDERLATAGSGDVLTGIIGALLAGGSDPLRAAATAAWVHAESGRRAGRHGLVAGDLVAALPGVLDRLLGERPDRSRRRPTPR